MRHFFVEKWRIFVCIILEVAYDVIESKGLAYV